MTALRRGAPLVFAAVVATGLAGCGAAESVATSSATSRATAIATTTFPVTPTAPVDPTAPSSSSATTDAPVEHSPPVVPNAAKLKVARSHPVEDPYYPDTSNPEVDVLHYFLDLTWDGSTLTGVATETIRAARATDSVRLDLSNALHVSSVKLGGNPIDFAQADDGLVMNTGSIARNSTYTLTIDYSGTPTSTPAPSFRSDTSDGLGWVVDPDGTVHTFQEPYGAFTWYPVNDHPSDEALYDARIITPVGDVGVFNGTLASSTSTAAGHTNLWHLDEPAASYLTTIAIGPYSRRTVTTANGVQISYWLITLSRGAARRPDAVLEHEMSHQWFGDSVTPVDWQGVWLNEGWAMYMQQWYERDTNRTPYAGGMAQWRHYDTLSRRVSGPPGDYNPQSFGDVNIYLGPAMMLDRIRQRLGDKTFKGLVKEWPAEHANQNVDRYTFQTWLDRKTGENFGPLMHRWLDSARTPR